MKKEHFLLKWLILIIIGCVYLACEQDSEQKPIINDFNIKEAKKWFYNVTNGSIPITTHSQLKSNSNFNLIPNWDKANYINLNSHSKD